MDLSLVSSDAQVYLQGLKNTLVLVSASFALGLILAAPLAVLEINGHRLVRALVAAFVWSFRTIPLLVQMLLVYYGLGQSGLLQGTFLWPMFKAAYFCALFTFCLTTCAHAAEILKGALLATPAGAIEAARAAGMSTVQLLRRIVLPRAARRISTYSREMVFMLHGCVLTSVITFFDIAGAARLVNFLNYSPYQALSLAAGLYLTITLSVFFLARTLIRRRPRSCRPVEETITEAEASP